MKESPILNGKSTNEKLYITETKDQFNEYFIPHWKNFSVQVLKLKSIMQKLNKMEYILMLKLIESYMWQNHGNHLGRLQ